MHVNPLVNKNKTLLGVSVVFHSIRAGIVVIDAEMRIKAWNRGAEDLWGVRRDEAEGTHLLNLDTGLPVADVRPMVREALSDPSYYGELLLDAINRRGRTTVVRLLCSSNGESHGALLMMDEAKPGQAP